VKATDFLSAKFKISEIPSVVEPIVTQHVWSIMRSVISGLGCAPIFTVFSEQETY